MPLSPISRSSQDKNGDDRARQRITRDLRVVVAASVFVSAIVGGLIVWQRLFPIPPERLVEVYRTHGCRCVFGWVKSLEASGFVVNVSEMHTLKSVRASMHTPDNLNGCHVAAYLGYFVEGHVVPEALRKLSGEHPAGVGVVTQATLTATASHVGAYVDENSPVLLLRNQQPAQLWFQPES